jgi:hypothetical protein
MRRSSASLSNMLNMNETFPCELRSRSSKAALCYTKARRVFHNRICIQAKAKTCRTCYSIGNVADCRTVGMTRILIPHRPALYCSDISYSRIFIDLLPITNSGCDRLMHCSRSMCCLSQRPQHLSTSMFKSGLHQFRYRDQFVQTLCDCRSAVILVSETML